MAVDSTIVQSLIEQLTKERQAYIESANKTHELLQQILDSTIVLLSLPSLGPSRPPSSTDMEAR